MDTAPDIAQGCKNGAMTDTPDALDLDSLDHVKTVLRLDGIEPSEADLASLTKLFPSLQRKVDRFYEIQTGDEVTASVFRADSDS
tara:strand:+ start:400 stop:654 length:255 start_codon:yes stop_codon:yes gene_type:complete